MKIFHALCLLLLAASTAAVAGPNPYDEKADAKLEIKQALKEATAAHVPVIIVFGANWCPDCQILHQALTTGASAQLLAKHFQIVDVNVGQFDKNVDLAKSYGVPLKKGIPAVVIVSPKNKVLYATHDGELADARRMGDKGIYDFFKHVTAPDLPKK